MTGSLTACPTNVTGQGYYRSGWTSYNDVKAQSADGTTACTPCGPGILSALTDIDEKEGGNDTSKLVAGSSYSCYIQAGWGMVPTGVVLADNTMQFAATLCANNTYGVANTTYGLQSTPCKVGIFLLVTELTALDIMQICLSELRAACTKFCCTAMLSRCRTCY
jgi:hypothetical protein